MGEWQKLPQIYSSTDIGMFRAPKAAVKRIFLITDEDDPHPGAKSAQLVTSAQTTLLVRFSSENPESLTVWRMLRLNRTSRNPASQ